MKKLKVILFSLLLCFSTIFVAACNTPKTKDVSSVSAENLKQYYYLEEELDLSQIKIDVTYADKSTGTLTKGEFDIGSAKPKDGTEFVLDTDGLSEKMEGNSLSDAVGSYDFKVTLLSNNRQYDLMTVVVDNDMSHAYIMASYSKPDNFADRDKYTAGGSQDDEANFKLYEDTTLTIGNDNPIDIEPKFSLRSLEDDNVVDSANIDINLNVEVKNEQGSVVANDNSVYTVEGNKLKFADTIIGETYTITVTPTDFDDPDFTYSIKVKVEDGYNIYNAYELGLINIEEEGVAAARSTYFYGGVSVPLFQNKERPNESKASVVYNDIWKNFLMTKGFTEEDIKPVSAVFLLKDISVEADDLPSEYFIQPEENEYAAGSLRDFSFLYQRLLTNNDFTVNGNYFKLNFENIREGRSIRLKEESNLTFYNEGSDVTDYKAGHSSVFAFVGLQNNSTQGKGYIKNLDINGNGYTKDLNITDENKNAILAKSGSLMFVKALKAGVQVDNTLGKNFLIGFYPEECITPNTGIDINDSKLFDCYNSAIFSFLSSYGGNAKNSEFKRFGGPVIFLLSADDGKPNSITATFNFDEASELESYVGGNEAWFAMNGANGIVTKILGIDTAMSDYLHKTIVSPYVDKEGITHNDKKVLNLICLSMDRAYLSSHRTDIPTKLTWGDVEFDTTIDPDGQSDALANFFNKAKQIATAAHFNEMPPVIAGSTSGKCFFTGSKFTTTGVDTYTGPFEGKFCYLMYAYGETSLAAMFEMKSVA